MTERWVVWASEEGALLWGEGLKGPEGLEAMSGNQSQN